jgi:hypothetical protein
LHPAKQAKFLDKLIRKEEVNGDKNFQKNFKNFLPVKKRSCTFAPALRNTLTSVNEGEKEDKNTFLDILN